MWRDLSDISFTRTVAESRGPARSSAQDRPRPSVSSRRQRRLIEALRRAVARADAPPPQRPFQVVMLLDRVAAVRDDLLELARRIEEASDPDPVAIDTLWGLLTDGGQSPLYNREIHPSELAATLYYATRRLRVDRGVPSQRPSAPATSTAPPGAYPLAGRSVMHGPLALDAGRLRPR